MSLLLLLLACSEQVIDPRDTEATGTCEDDEACDAASICEQDQCVLGDRSEGLDSAIPIVKTADPTDAPSAVGIIQTEGDIDYYRFDALEPQWVRIQTLSDFPEELNTVLAVLDASGGVHAWVDDFATGRITTYDSVLHVYLPTAGAWYITVQDRGTWFDLDEVGHGDDLTYGLSILDFTATTTETDALDNPSASVDLASGSSIYTVGVNLEEPGDADYIAVDLNWSDAPIEVYGLPELGGSDARIRTRILNADGEAVSDKRDLGPEGAQAAFTLAAGTYTVEASDAFDAGSENHWFPLYFRTRTEGEHYTLEVEPNGVDAPQSLPLERLTTNNGTPYDRAWMQGVLQQDADEDVFTVAARAEDYLTIRCDGEAFGSVADMQLELIDGSGDVVATATEGNDAMPDLENYGPVASDDTYTLRLFGENDTVYGPASYYRCLVFITTFEVSR